MKPLAFNVVDGVGLPGRIVSYGIQTITVLFLCLLSVFLHPLAAQDWDAGYQDEVIEKRPFSEKTWDGLVKELDYSPRKKKKKKEKKKEEEKTPEDSPEFPDFSLEALPGILKGGLIVCLALLLAWLIHKLLVLPEQQNSAKEITGMAPKERVTLEYIEENLHQTDVNPYISEAEKQEDYMLATRLRYMSVLKLLTEKEAIKWKRDYTNKIYLRQMRQHPNFSTFRNLTRTFEQVWYGKHDLTASSYGELKRQFEEFKGDINLL